MAVFSVLFCLSALVIIFYRKPYLLTSSLSESAEQYKKDEKSQAFDFVLIFLSILVCAIGANN